GGGGVGPGVGCPGERTRRAGGGAGACTGCPMTGLAAADVCGLFSLFPPAEFLARSDLVAPEDLPPPYDRLLVHQHHMTVTVEAYHGTPVDVEVLREHRGRQTYARQSMLRLRGSRRVVQFNLMRVHFRYCDHALP